MKEKRDTVMAMTALSLQMEIVCFPFVRSENPSFGSKSNEEALGVD